MGNCGDRITMATPKPNLAELETLAKAATPGPWEHNIQPGAADNGIYEANGASIADVKWRGGSLRQFRYEDAFFIAAANPQTILALVSALKEAVEELNTLKDETSDQWVPCPGTHTQYSSMINDAICNLCGHPEDGPGADVRRSIPTQAAMKARQALSLIRGKVGV